MIGFFAMSLFMLERSTLKIRMKYADTHLELELAGKLSDLNEFETMSR